LGDKEPMKETLKPCSFCGSKNIDMWPMGKFESPVCTQCGATICENYKTGDDTDEQIKAWNTRAEVKHD